MGVLHMSLPGGSDKEKFDALCSRTHKEQIEWFMNAYWSEYGEANAETMWTWNLKCAELDIQNHEDGNSLDELNAHRFLEHFNEPMTVRDLRDGLRSTGAIGGNLRQVPVTHIIIFKFKLDWKELVNRSIANQAELHKAQKMLDGVTASFKEAEKRTEEARALEAPFKAAQEELEEALAVVHKEEEEYNGKIADCEKRAETGGVVQKNKAKAELAQLKAEDPLPLRKAKITLSAAQKRAEKARAPFAEARAAAEAAMEEARRQVEEAEAYLNEIKNQPGQPYGSIWWVDRELHEQKKYLPEAKGGIRKA